MAKAKKKAVASKKTSKKVMTKAKPKKTVAKSVSKAKTAKKVKKVAVKKSLGKIAKKTIKTATKKPVAASKSSAPKSVKLPAAMLSPLDDRLLVRVSGVERKTPGGLFIPDTVSDTSGNLQGVVAAVGRGHLSKKGKLRTMDVSIGDQIVFTEYAGSKVSMDGQDYVILRESDVLGIVQK